MRIALIFVLLIGVEAQGQSLADVARAERKRQQAVEAAMKIQKLGDKAAAVQQEVPPAADSEKAKKEPEKELPLEQKLRNERVDLVKKRSELLVRLSEVKDDPEAVKSIEAELIGLTKRAELLKLEHLHQGEKPQNK